MYLVLYCHNIGMTDFSFFETEDFDKEEGYIVRGKWPNELAFRDYLVTEFGDLASYKVIDLICDGKQAEDYSQQDLTLKAQQI
ncbi:hypothetical protein QWZ04_07100 [Vibrio tapetis subsp. quintayensis]|uniref:hypothetical protein n=1 Tax=Vibrio tapetis TaxID=52443 RepID=UPI0025B53CA8|nr:hypothetical protein [Vibrio tapetis]MDN3680093.1 hypothetical protein [Vibrio tapetis subsp. quintayensis]